MIEKIILGDNLQILKTINNNMIDLIYIDPPFYSQKNYIEFDDKWDSLEDYLNFMRVRIKELHRILKNTGSFYLHCDYHASHHLKIICDDIFGYDNFKANIIWKRTTQVKGVKNNYSKNLDNILFYTKGKKYTFNTQYIPLNKEQKNKYYNNIEKKTRRKFNTSGLIRKGKGVNKLKFHDKGIITSPNDKSFGWSQETYEKEYKKNPLCIYWGKNNKPRKKIYLDEHKGIPLSTLWDDIQEISINSKERIGYPTQKPEKLLERIIKASSNEGDIVLDAFCGYGTTLAVAKKLNRQYIGIDNNSKAIELCKKRLNLIKNNKR